MCGTVVPVKGIKRNDRSTFRGVFDGRRYGPALAFLAVAAFGSVAGPAALAAREASVRPAASVTIKLPPARPAQAEPHFT